MHQSLKIFLIAAMICITGFKISGDTLTYIDDKITIKGRIIEKNAQTVKFALNIFKKTSKGYAPMILTAASAKVQVVEEEFEANEKSITDKSAQRIQDLCTLAEKSIFDGDYNQAYQLFEKAKLLYNNLSDEVKEKSEELKKQIYQGLLRFKLLELVKNLDNPRKLQVNKESIKQFTIAADVTTEYLDYLRVLLNTLVKNNAELIQQSLLLALKIYRTQHKELLNLLTQNKSERRGKFLRYQLDNSLDSLRAIYEKPQSVIAMQALLNVKYFLKSKKILAGLLQKLEKSEITKIKKFFSGSLYRDLLGVHELIKLRKLFNFWFPEDETCSEYKEFAVKMKIIEKNWGKSISSKKVSEILNADIIQYKKDNEEILNAGLAELSSSENSLYQLINQHREMFGLNPLINKQKVLGKAASKYLRILAKMDKISHEGSNGSTPLTRVLAEGWRTQNVAENLYRAETKNAPAKQVFQAWLSKPLHSLNIINPGFDCCGIANSANDWILILAGP